MKTKFIDILNIIWRSILCGSVVGLVITFFILGAERIMAVTKDIYRLAGNSVILIVILFGILIFIAFLINFIFSFVPQIDGNYNEKKTSKKGIIDRATDFNWLFIGLSYLCSTYLSFFAGLPLGSERPSAFLGSSLGEGIANYLGREKKTYYKIFGESAGITVAVSAPITGFIYALEEGYKKNKDLKFTPLLIMGTLLSSLSAYFVSYCFIALLLKQEFFHLSSFEYHYIPIKYILYMILLGIIIGLVAGLFFVIAKTGQSFFSKIHIKPFYLLSVALAITGVMGLIHVGDYDGNVLLGSGSNVILSTLKGEYSAKVIGIYFAVKIAVILICICSGANGGLFVPSLMLGALIGGILCKFFAINGMPNELFPSMIIISSAAFMGCFMHLPFTAFFLSLEIMGFNIFSEHFSFGLIIPTFIIVLVSYFVSMYSQINPIKLKMRLKRHKK